LTEINTVPSLSIHGSKDGLYRISRSAEAFYHQVENIAPAYKNRYPVVVAEGVSHASFMDEKMMSSFVAANDLMADMPEAEAHSVVAKIMVNFITHQLGFDDAEEGLEYQLF